MEQKQKTQKPVIFELKCSCGKVCGDVTFPPGAQVDFEKLKKSHTTVCDGCAERDEK